MRNFPLPLKESSSASGSSRKCFWLPNRQSLAPEPEVWKRFNLHSTGFHLNIKTTFAFNLHSTRISTPRIPLSESFFFSPKILNATIMLKYYAKKRIYKNTFFHDTSKIKPDLSLLQQLLILLNICTNFSFFSPP